MYNQDIEFVLVCGLIFLSFMILCGIGEGIARLKRKRRNR